jgi:hypothetical protein
VLEDREVRGAVLERVAASCEGAPPPCPPTSPAPNDDALSPSLPRKGRALKGRVLKGRVLPLRGTRARERGEGGEGMRKGRRGGAKGVRGWAGGGREQELPGR